MAAIDSTGGPPQTLCDATASLSGSWSREGVIVFADRSGLALVPAVGGVPAPVTKVDGSRKETAHIGPWFLPDGRRFLYQARAGGENDALYVASLDGKPEPKRLLSTEYKGVYAPPINGDSGHLLFMRGQTLMAQPFDAGAVQLRGEPFPVAEQVATIRGATLAPFSVSSTGVLAYWSAGQAGLTELVWFDRSGKRLGPFVGPPARYRNPRLSPDDKRVAVERLGDTGNGDIWLFDLARGTPSRFTFHAAIDAAPVWSPDGSRIAFVSERDGPRSLYQKDSSGAGNEIGRAHV